MFIFLCVVCLDPMLWINRSSSTHTRTYLWNTKRPQPPPIQRGINYLVYAYVFNIIGQLPVAESVTPKLSFEPIYTSPRQFVTKKQPGKAHVSKKTRYFYHLNKIKQFLVAELATTSKGTSTRHDLSYEPIPRHLRPSVKQIQPWKRIDDGPTDTPNL